MIVGLLEMKRALSSGKKVIVIEGRMTDFRWEFNEWALNEDEKATNVHHSGHFYDINKPSVYSIGKDWTTIFRVTKHSSKLNLPFTNSYNELARTTGHSKEGKKDTNSIWLWQDERGKERRERHKGGRERSSIQFCFLLLQKVLLYCDGDLVWLSIWNEGRNFSSITRPIVRPLGFIRELNEFISWSETERDDGEWREVREGGRRRDYGRWREKGNRSWVCVNEGCGYQDSQMERLIG